jgi:hypothetical protein
MSKPFFLVIASKSQKAIPIDEVVYTIRPNGSVARLASYDEAVEVASGLAKGEKDTSFIVMKALTVYETEPKVVRRGFSS